MPSVGGDQKRVLERQHGSRKGKTTEFYLEECKNRKKVWRHLGGGSGEAGKIIEGGTVLTRPG